MTSDSGRIPAGFTFQADAAIIPSMRVEFRITAHPKEVQ